MQISRHLLVACAVATCFTPVVSLRAYDNEAQIRARQALEDKMNQIAQTNAPAPAVAPKPASKAKKSPPPAPAETPAAPAPAAAPEISQPATPVAPAAAPVDAATEDKLRDALHQQTVQAPATSAPAPVTQPVQATAPVDITPAADDSANQKLRDALHQQTGQTQPAPAPVVQTPAPAVAPAQVETPAPVNITPAADDSANQKLQDALHEKINEYPATPAPVVAAPTNKVKAAPKPAPAPAPIVMTPTPAAPVVVTAKPAAPVYVEPAAAPKPAPVVVYSSTPTTTGSASNDQLNQALNQKMGTTTPPPSSGKATPAPISYSLPTLAGPPLPVSAAKQQKLDALLQQYRMDQVTPAQYHQQRAQILSQP